MKNIFWILVSLVLIGCSNAGASLSEPSEDDTISSQQIIDLKDYGTAPEIQNEVWLNTDRPLRLSELQGKVVLLEMWTYG